MNQIKVIKRMKRIKKFVLALFKYETSAKKLALACSIALYIAFSPFIGFHTMMLIVSGWLFNLNIPLLLLVGYTINNPLTMVPIYLSGYVCGYWILHTFLHLNVVVYNPWWMHSLNDFLYTTVGIPKISFWAFLIGGNIVGIFLALLSYPLLYRFFKKSADKQIDFIKDKDRI